MSWDFLEICPTANFSGNWLGGVSWVADVLDELVVGPGGTAKQLDATASIDGNEHPLIVTDPPYYDNIGYADLSDFFYIWLRRSVSDIDHTLFSTLLVPKQQELVATPFRFGGDRDRAKHFFEEGFKAAFLRMRSAQHPDYPLSVFYAFKQAEADVENDDGHQMIASTGWETILEGLHQSGFEIGGTWPIRSEKKGRMLSVGTNALASSVVLTCRPRLHTGMTTRRELLSELKRELPQALRRLQRGNIAPVDLAQAAIGPGMSIFSHYAKVIEADGTAMAVRTALALINQVLDEVLAEQEGEFDPDTRWALTWFEQHAFDEGSFGDAETLSKAKDTSINGMVQAGIVAARGGKVRLLRREEFPKDWESMRNQRLTVWEITQQLIRELELNGEIAAAALVRKVGFLGETSRDLAYRLYNICERNKWAQDAIAYNSLVTAWAEISRLASAEPDTVAVQGRLV
jgi:putative DNA methylase